MKESKLAHSEDNARSGYWFTWGYIVLAALLFGVLYAYACPMSDDLAYSMTYRDYLVDGAPFPGLGRWFESLKTHYLCVNGRFNDKLMPLMVLQPQWLKFIMGTCFVGVMLSGSVLLAFGRKGLHDIRGALVVSAMMLLPPWYEGAIMDCIFANYQMSVTFTVVWLCLFFRCARSRFGGIWVDILLFIFSVWAGGAHEMGSVVMLPGLLLAIIIMRKISRRQWWLIAGLITGAALLISSPAFWARVGIDLHTFERSMLSTMAVAGNVALLYPIIVLIVGIAMYRRRRLNQFSRVQWGLIIVAFSQTVITTVMYVTVGYVFLRMWWWADVLAIVGYAVMLTALRPRRILMRICLAVTAVIVLVPLIISIPYQVNIYKEYYGLIARFRKSENGYLYHDLKYIGQFTPWTMKHTQREVLIQFENKGRSNLYRGDGVQLVVLPTSFRDMDRLTSGAERTEGKVTRLADGNYVAWLPQIKGHSLGQMTFIDSKGQEGTVRVWGDPLPADSKSAGFVFLRLDPHVWQFHLDIASPEGALLDEL